MKKILYFLSVILILASCTTSDDSTSDVETTEDGFSQITAIDMTLEWRATSDNTLLEVRVTAPSTGWVGVGFTQASTSKMNDANIIMGYVEDNGDVVISDEHGTSQTSHSTDETANVTLISGTESDSETVLWFTIPLDSGDAEDTALTIGEATTLLLAYNSNDNLTTTHTSSKRVKTTIESL
jgi:hypothetical protein